MMKCNLIWFFIIVLFGFSCSPKVSVTFFQSYPVLDYREDVQLYNIDEEVPADAEDIGMVRVYDPGGAKNCEYDLVVMLAEFEARKIGGNAIKIIDHTLPGLKGSTCHQITAKIMKIKHEKDASSIVKNNNRNDSLDIKVHKNDLNQNSVSLDEPELSPVNKFDNEEIIYIYDYNGVSLNNKPKSGMLPKRLEKKDQILLKNGTVQKCWIIKEDGGYVYYRYYEFGNMVDAHIAKSKIEGIQRSRKYLSKLKDIIIFKDGKSKELSIEKEDDDKVYFKINRNSQQILTFTPKTNIKQIIYAERLTDSEQ